MDAGPAERGRHGLGPLVASPAILDLHCHILPGVDDGPAELSDSVGMARQAQRDGIEAICATPHIRSDHDVHISELPSRVAEVNAELERHGIAVRVLSGGEVAEPIVDDLDEVELRAVSLGGGGRWILLEPPAGPLDSRMANAVRRLAAHGLGAVIAHPERHLGEDLNARLGEIVGLGAVTQVTAAFLLDQRIAPGLLDLAAQGLVHVLGSDSHSSRGGRPVALREALEVLRGVERVSGHLEWIAEGAPRAIVAGEPLEPPF